MTSNRERATSFLNQTLDQIEEVYPRKVFIINKKPSEQRPAIFKEQKNENSFNRASVVRAIDVTLKRLRDKGLLLKNAADLVDKLNESNPILLASLCSSLRKLNYGDPEAELFITDEEWKLAILYTVCEEKEAVDLLATQTDYVYLLTPRTDHLYANALTFHYFTYSYNTIFDIKDRIAGIPLDNDGWKKKIDEQTEAIRALKAENRSLVAEKERLQAELDRTSAANHAQWKEYQTNLLNAERESKERENDLLELVEELEDRVDELEAAAEADEEKDEEALLKELELEERLASVELPTKRVLLLGGHVRTTNRIKELYPDWTYVNPNTQRTNVEKTEYDVIFCLNKYIAHKQYWQAMKRGEGIPIYYSTSSNVDQILKAFKLGYLDYLEKKEGGQL